MKHQFFIILIFIVLYFISACSKKQNEQIESNLTNEQTTSYREQINSRSKTTQTSDTTKKTNRKTVQEKINKLRIFSVNDLLSPSEIALLSDKLRKEYIEKLARRVFDITEEISLDIYNHLIETGLIDLCDNYYKRYFFGKAVGYINNQRKGFDEIYKMHDEYLSRNNMTTKELLGSVETTYSGGNLGLAIEITFTGFAGSYIKYLKDSQDYQKLQELLDGPFHEIADSLKKDNAYNINNIGKMTEPFSEYQAKMQNFIINTSKNSEKYKYALSDLAERMAREELYPDYKFEAKNIVSLDTSKIQNVEINRDDDGNITTVKARSMIFRGGGGTTSSYEDPTKRMFTEFGLMMNRHNEGYFNNPEHREKIAEFDRYVKAFSNAYQKLVAEYGEPIGNKEW